MSSYKRNGKFLDGTRGVPVFDDRQLKASGKYHKCPKCGAYLKAYSEGDFFCTCGYARLADKPNQQGGKAGKNPSHSIEKAAQKQEHIKSRAPH